MIRTGDGKSRVTSARPSSGSTPSRRSVNPRVSRRVWVLVLRIAVVAAFLSFWQFAVSDDDVVFFSRPTLVAERLVELLVHSEIWHNIQVTATEIAIGYAIGATIGLAVGALFARSQFVSDIFQPFVFVLYSIPKIAIAPLFIITLGLGISSKIAIVAMSAFFLVFVNTYSGMRNINEEFVQLARIMGASRGQVVRHVVVPAASPYILVGLRTAVPYACVGAIIGEFIGSNEGLGYFILNAGQVFNSTSMIAGIIILVAIVLTVNQALTMLDARVLRWQPQRAASRVHV